MSTAERPTRINVQIHGGYRFASAYVRGVVAVHRSVEWPRDTPEDAVCYTVTHAPSGLCLLPEGAFLSLADALLLRDALCEADLDWTFHTPAEVPVRTRDEVYRIRGAYLREEETDEKPAGV